MGWGLGPPWPAAPAPAPLPAWSTLIFSSASPSRVAKVTCASCSPLRETGISDVPAAPRPCRPRSPPRAHRDPFAASPPLPHRSVTPGKDPLVDARTCSSCVTP